MQHHAVMHSRHTPSRLRITVDARRGAGSGILFGGVIAPGKDDRTDGLRCDLQIVQQVTLQLTQKCRLPTCMTPRSLTT